VTCRYVLRIGGYVGFLTWRLVNLREELFAPKTLSRYLPVLFFHLLGCAMQVKGIQNNISKSTSSYMLPFLAQRLQLSFRRLVASIRTDWHLRLKFILENSLRIAVCRLKYLFCYSYKSALPCVSFYQSSLPLLFPFAATFTCALIQLHWGRLLTNGAIKILFSSKQEASKTAKVN